MLSRRRRREEGQVAVELLGSLPFLILAFLAALQLIFAVVTVQATSTAARSAARSISKGDNPTTAARSAVPDWVENKMRVDVNAGLNPSVSVTTRIPILFPGLASGPSVTRSAWFENEHGQSLWG